MESGAGVLGFSVLVGMLTRAQYKRGDVVQFLIPELFTLK